MTFKNAVILAGGEGLRLKPLTLSSPKALMIIKDKPIIAHILDYLISYDFNDITITTQYMRKSIVDYVRNYILNNYTKNNMNIHFPIEERPLGTAGSVKNAFKYREIPSPILVMQGDTFTNIDLNSAIKFHENQPKALATIVLMFVENPSRYGIVQLDSDFRIISFTEKPLCQDNRLVSTGIYIIEPEFLDLIPSNQKVDFAKDIFQKKCKDYVFYGFIPYSISELKSNTYYWYDVGTIEDFKKIND